MCTSPLGKDIKAGALERTHVRLVVERILSNQLLVELHEQYTNQQRDREGRQ